MFSMYNRNDLASTILKAIFERDPTIQVDNSKLLLNKIAKRKSRYQNKLLSKYSCLNTDYLHNWVLNTKAESNLRDSTETGWKSQILSYKIGDGSDEKPMLIVFSSKNLLQNLVRQQKFEAPYLCLDSTEQ